MDKKVKRTLYCILGVVAYFLLLKLLVVVEQPYADSNIQNFGDAFWYSLVTLTTVGYGDYFPVSLYGRIIGGAFVLASLGFLGFLVGKIGDKFAEYRERKRLGYDGTDFVNHFVVIGWNNFTELVVRELVLSGKKVAIITDSRDSIDLIRNEFDRDTVFSLFTDLDNFDNYSKVNVNEAARVLISPDSDTDTLVGLLNLRDEFSQPEYVVTVENVELVDTLKENGADYVISRHDAASGVIASYIFEPDVADYLNDLMASISQNGDHEFQQYQVTENCEFDDRNYGEVFKNFYEEYGEPVVGLRKNQPEDNRLLKLPPDDVKVQAGDYLVLIATGENMEEIEAFFGVSQGIKF